MFRFLRFLLIANKHPPYEQFQKGVQSLSMLGAPKEMGSSRSCHPQRSLTQLQIKFPPFIPGLEAVGFLAKAVKRRHAAPS